MKKAPSVFKKRYTEKKYASKIRKKLHIAADREYVESLFIEETDPKSGKTFRVFDLSKVTDKQSEKRVKKLAKEIKKQKGRLNLVSFFAALLFFGAVISVFGIFRNEIARRVIVTAAENTFGAKCDLESVDFNLASTSFKISGLAVANRDKPMTNLFEIGEAELSLDLLWLTRGKFHAEQGKITHIAWGTERSVSGALPPKQEEAFKAKQEAAKTDSSGTGGALFGGSGSPVNISAGFSAVTDMLDPRKILDAEIANLSLPGTVEKVTQSVPAMTAKWTEQNKALKTQTDTVVKTGKTVAAIKPTSLKTLEDIQAAIKTVEASKSVIEDGVKTAKQSAEEIKADIASVAALKKEAEAAYKNDAARLSTLASSVKAANLETGTKVLSSVFESFASATLGEWYPKIEKAVAMAVKLQKRSKENQAESLKKKSGALSRSTGRTISFGVANTPTLLLKNLELGIDAPGISGIGTLTDITDDQELNGKPSAFSVKLAHGSMSETFTGFFDLRDKADPALQTDFTGQGYPISIPAPNTPGVPSIRGSLVASGALQVKPTGDAIIEAELALIQAKIETAPFDPSWAYSAYQEVLSSLTTVDGTMNANVPRKGNPSISFKTDADKELGAAIAASVSNRIAGLKKDVQKLAESWLADQQAAYAPQIAKFTSVTGITPDMAKNALAYETIVEDKKAELEQRAKDLVNEQAEALRKAAEAAAAAAKAEADRIAAAAQAEADKAAAAAKAEADKAAAEAKAASDKAAADAKAKAGDQIKKLF